MICWFCFTPHRQRGHLETAPPFTVPCKGREGQFLHRSHRASRGSPLHYHCTTTNDGNCTKPNQVSKGGCPNQTGESQVHNDAPIYQPDPAIMMAALSRNPCTLRGALLFSLSIQGHCCCAVRPLDIKIMSFGHRNKNRD